MTRHELTIMLLCVMAWKQASLNCSCAYRDTLQTFRLPRKWSRNVVRSLELNQIGFLSICHVLIWLCESLQLVSLHSSTFRVCHPTPYVHDYFSQIVSLRSCQVIRMVGYYMGSLHCGRSPWKFAIGAKVEWAFREMWVRYSTWEIVAMRQFIKSGNTSTLFTVCSGGWYSANVQLFLSTIISWKITEGQRKYKDGKNGFFRSSKSP